MMAKVREALFSMLTSLDVLQETATMLDTFSGTGVVGLEALSRGVGNVTFVDASSTCVSTIVRNCEELGFDTRARVVKARVEDVLSSPARYGVASPVSVVTLTPPYEEVSYPELLDALLLSPVLGEDTIAVVEYPKEISLPSSLGDGRLQGLRNREHGRTVLAIYICDPTGRCEVTPRPKEFELSRKR